MSKIAGIIKSKLDIIDVMRKDGLELKLEGYERYSCLCPFHNEKTPSFKVDGIYQSYKCFGCGESGDVISYYAKTHAIDDKTAIVILAEKLNIKVDNKYNNDFEKQKRYLLIAEELEKFYKNEFAKLDNTHLAKQQILKRKLNIQGYEDYFGYAPNNNDMITYMLGKKFNIDELKELGFISDKGNPQLKNRLVFFIRNYMGKTIGFSGRSLENNPDGYKYVNSKASQLYDKSSTFYGIEKAKKSIQQLKTVYIVEGQFDVMAMHQKGYLNTIAISGTAFTNKHIEILDRLIGEDGKIILCLDGDSAGFNAMLKIFQSAKILQNRLYSVILPNKQDPCEYLENNTEFPKETNLIELFIHTIKNKHNLELPSEKEQFLTKIKNNIIKYINNSQMREVYDRYVCDLVNVSYIKTQPVKENKKIENTQPKNNISKSDMNFLYALGFYFLNKENISIELNENDYPEKYYQTVLELKQYSSKVLISENFSKPKIIEYIKSLNIDYIKDKDLCDIQYKSFIDNGKKEIENLNKNKRINDIISMLQNKSNDEIIEYMKSVKK